MRSEDGRLRAGMRWGRHGSALSLLLNLVDVVPLEEQDLERTLKCFFLVDKKVEIELEAN